MFIFGHTGITLGVASLAANLLPGDRKISWFAALGSRLDIRWLLAGSLLPDIIDKPLGIYIFTDALSNGRIFSHTILFLLVVALAGIFMFRSLGKTQLLAVSFGVLTHLIFDQMWLAPRTLFWPVSGLAFDKEGTTDWIVRILQRLAIDPAVYIPECVGAVVLIIFTITLVKKREFFRFLKHGQVQ